LGAEEAWELKGGLVKRRHQRRRSIDRDASATSRQIGRLDGIGEEIARDIPEHRQRDDQELAGLANLKKGEPPRYDRWKRESSMTIQSIGGL